MVPDYDRFVKAAEVLGELAHKTEQHVLDSENTASATDLATMYVEIKDLLEGLEKALKPLSDVKGALQSTIVPKAFERDHITNVKLTSGHRVTISAGIRASMKDKDAAMQWLQDNNLGDLIQPTVNASTLSAAAKHLMEDEGKELPEDLFNTYIFTNTSVTKTKA